MKPIVAKIIKKFPLLWNPNVHYRVHKSPPLDNILRLQNLIHNLSSRFFKIHRNIVFPPTPRSLKRSPYLIFSDQNYV